MARVITKTGDEGYTDLLGDARVPKYHRRPEAYGDVDELSAILGLARAAAGSGSMNDEIQSMQRNLYTLMAELATPAENFDKTGFHVAPEAVFELDGLADSYKQRVDIGKKFVIPGDTIPGAYLDVARTVARRAERKVAKLYHDGDVRTVHGLQYLNRLSDVLFIMARFRDAHGANETGSSTGGSAM